MAGPFTIDTLNSVTDKFYVRQLIDNFFLSSPLLAKLREREKPVDGGIDIRIPVSYSNTPNAGRWSGGTGILNTSIVQTSTQAVFSDVHYYASITLAKTDVVKNKGRAQIADYVRAQVETAEATLRDNMGIDLFLDGTADANGNTGLAGLSAMITYDADPGPGAYGGITRVSATGSKNAPVGNAFWNANAVTAGGGAVTRWRGTVNGQASTVLSLAMMQEIFSACSVGNEMPDIFVTSPTLYNKYVSLLTTIQRTDAMNLTGQQGFKYVLYNDTPVCPDDNIDAATKMYCLNTSHMFWRPFAGNNFDTTPFAEPVNQRALVKLITWQGNVCNDRPNTSGVLTSVTTS